MLRRLIEAFFQIPTPLAVALVFGVASLETALFIGFFLPGETAVLLGGVLAARGHVSLAWIIPASIAAPIAGDVTGYFLGRRYGEDFVRRRLKRKWQRAHAWLSKKAGWTIFVGRFIPFLRTVLPATAGAMRYPTLRFLAWDLCAGAVWGVGTALLGYVGAREYKTILAWLGRAGYAVAAVLILAAGLFLLGRLRRRRGAGTRGRA
jgi:membrane-associated protein